MFTEESVRWAKAAGIRAVKTMAQTALGTIGGTAMFTDVNWAVVLSATIMAGFASILTSLAGLPELKVEDDSDAGSPFI